MKHLITILISTLFAANVFAHEGHDHDAPASVKPVKGGIVRSLEELNVEVVTKGKDVTIYMFDHDMKPRKTEGLKVSAEAELPRKKGKSVLVLKDNGDHYTTVYDAKNAHRYDLKLKIFDPKVGHDDDLKFTIEPRRN